MKHFIYHGLFSEAGVRNTMILLSEALVTGADAITLHIGSHGGDVNAGITLFNFLRMLPIATHTHALGLCESIAATVLLAGKHRSAAPLAAFSLHAPTYSEGPRRGQVSPNTDLISAPFATVCNWSAENISQRFATHGEYRMTADDAKRLGIVHDIADISLSSTDSIVTINVG